MTVPPEGDAPAVWRLAGRNRPSGVWQGVIQTNRRNDGPLRGAANSETLDHFQAPLQLLFCGPIDLTGSPRGVDLLAAPVGMLRPKYARLRRKVGGGVHVATGWLHELPITQFNLTGCRLSADWCDTRPCTANGEGRALYGRLRSTGMQSAFSIWTKAIPALGTKSESMNLI